jgi:type IV secretory pathway VirB10-like protein
MAFNTTSFYAGVGTMFAAVTIGFAGGAMLTSSPKMEPNRLERVAANTPATIPAAAKAETPVVASVSNVKAETPAVSPVLAKNETPETPAAPDRVVSTTPASPAQVVPPQPQPVVAKEVSREDLAAQIDNAKKIREGELRKQAEFRESERRVEQRRRKRQEIDAAVSAVRRMQRDGVLQEASQQDDSPRFGFFGRD